MVYLLITMSLESIKHIKLKKPIEIPQEIVTHKIVQNDSESDDEDVEYVSISSFKKKELCYYKMIDDYYKRCSADEIDRMLGIIRKTHSISLRVIDWFVTRYSKKRIDIEIDNNKETFDVHISYKAQLKSYKKKYFDPFRRGARFKYNYDRNDKSKVLFTTLGQLNFFKWAISNQIITYIENNLTNIIKTMNASNKEDKTKKKDKIISCEKKKIKVTATKTIEDDNVKIVLSFD
jgi:hypothetical protein